MHDELAWFTMIDFINQMLQAAIDDGWAADRRSVLVSESGSVAGYESFLFQALQQGRDGGIGPVSAGPLELREDFSNGA